MGAERTALAPAGIFALAFCLYAFTLAPGVQWGDVAQLQRATAQPELGVGARAYPLWTALSAGLARVAFSDPALAANALSALCGALAASLCFVCGRVATGSGAAAAAGAASFAVAHLVWSHSVVAEVYSLTACFIFALLIAARTSRASSGGAFALGLVAGLGLLHHRMVQVSSVAVFLAVLPAWFGVGRARRRTAFCALGFLLGAAPFLAIAARHPIPLRELLLGTFRPGLPGGANGLAGIPGLLVYEARFLLLNLAGPQVVLAAIGIVVALRRRLPEVAPALALCATAMVQPLVFSQFGDRFVLLLPAVAAIPLLVSVGAAAIGERARRAALAALVFAVAAVPPAAYAFLSRSDLPRRLGYFSPGAREQARQFLWPGKRGSGEPGRFARDVLSALPGGAVLLSGWGEGTVLQYAQTVLGLRPDVVVCILPASEVIDTIRARDVYATTYPPLGEAPSVPGWPCQEELVPGALWRLRRSPTR